MLAGISNQRMNINSLLSPSLVLFHFQYHQTNNIWRKLGEPQVTKNCRKLWKPEKILWDAVIGGGVDSS